MTEISGTGGTQNTGGVNTHEYQGGANGTGDYDYSDVLSKDQAELVRQIQDEMEAKTSEINSARETIERTADRMERHPNASSYWKNKWEDRIQTHEDRIKDLENKLEDLQSKIDPIKKAAEKLIKDLTDLDNLLANGDIEGAMMLVQTNRTLNLDRQIAERLKELQTRNVRISDLNDKLAALSKTKDEDLTGPQREQKAEWRGEIDKLNADTQLDTIKLQSLINKRNHALETLTNLLQKFQKVLDGIVANMR